MIDIPIDIDLRPRGEGSEERTKQEQREATALGALYISAAHIPDAPAEPPHVISEEETDRDTQIMACGSEADAVFWSGGGPASPPQSVADLVGQLAEGSIPLDPTLAAASFNGQGLDLAAVGLDANSTVSSIQALPQEQIQQLLQQLAGPAMFAQSDQHYNPIGTDQSGWAGYSTEFAQPQQYQDESDRGWKGRGRGRGRGRGGETGYRHHNKRPCSFFLAGRRAFEHSRNGVFPKNEAKLMMASEINRCKYGDQCDFAHEFS